MIRRSEDQTHIKIPLYTDITIDWQLAFASEEHFNFLRTVSSQAIINEFKRNIVGNRNSD